MKKEDKEELVIIDEIREADDYEKGFYYDSITKTKVNKKKILIALLIGFYLLMWTIVIYAIYRMRWSK